MFQIEQSTFLHALGYAIGHSLWQMSLLWLLYFGAIHVFNLSSNRKYLIAVAASITGFVAFASTIIYYVGHLQIADQETDALIMLSAIPEAVSHSESLMFIYNSVLATLRSLSPYLSCAYLAVMLLLSVRLANGFGQVKQLRKTGLSKPAIDWRLFVKEHARFLGIKRPVQVYISTIANSPLTIGFWKPIILIPLASINQLSTQQMEAVLLHELAHIRRHDYFMNIVLQVAEMALFFNPFMRLLLKQARLERENSCDDWVLQFRYNAADYARALLAIEKQSTQSLLALGSNNKNEFQLLNRVKRMIAPERQSFNYRQQLGLLFLITLLGLGFTVIVPRQKTTQKEDAVIVEEKYIEVKPEPSKPILGPIAIDLVKKLENIQKITKVVTTREFEQQSRDLAANAVEIAQKTLQGQEASKALEELPKKALAISGALEMAFKDNTFNFEDLKSNFQFQLDADQAFSAADLKEMEGGEAGKKISNLPHLYPMQGGNGFGQLWRMTTDAAREAEKKAEKEANRQRRISKLDEMEQQRLQVVRLQKAIKRMNDSLQVANHGLQQQTRSYQQALARAEKQAAIAPFRVTETNKAVEPKDYSYNYNYNYNYGPQDNTAWSHDMDNEHGASIAEPVNITRSMTKSKGTAGGQDVATCYVKANPTPQTVILIDGKKLAAKIKIMVDNVQAEIGDDEWTPELEKQIELEIKKEFKVLEKLNIKATIVNGSRRNNKTVSISIESH